MMELRFNGESAQSFQEPPILLAPFYKTPSYRPVLWRKEIDFDFGEGQRPQDFAALREKASVLAVRLCPVSP